MKKSNKSKYIVPIIFFLLYFFASGEDVPWIEIVLGSMLFSAIANFLVTLVYKFFVFLFNPMRLINKEEIALVVDEVLEERESKTI